MDYGQPVRLGVFIKPDATQPDRQPALAQLADELGSDLIGVQDHPYQRRFLDTWTLLVAMANDEHPGLSRRFQPASAAA